MCKIPVNDIPPASRSTPPPPPAPAGGSQIAVSPGDWSARSVQTEPAAEGHSGASGCPAPAVYQLPRPDWPTSAPRKNAISPGPIVYSFLRPLALTGSISLAGEHNNTPGPGRLRRRCEPRAHPVPSTVFHPTGLLRQTP